MQFVQNQDSSHQKKQKSRGRTREKWQTWTLQENEAGGTPRCCSTWCRSPYKRNSFRYHLHYLTLKARYTKEPPSKQTDTQAIIIHQSDLLENQKQFLNIFPPYSVFRLPQNRNYVQTSEGMKNKNAPTIFIKVSHAVQYVQVAHGANFICGQSFEVYKLHFCYSLGQIFN